MQKIGVRGYPNKVKGVTNENNIKAGISKVLSDLEASIFQATVLIFKRFLE